MGKVSASKTCNLPLGTGTLTFDALTFPMKKGSTSISVDIKLSAALPGALAHTDTTVTATGTGGDKLFCMGIKSAPAQSDEFDEFTKRFGRTYASVDEQEFRKKVFYKNLEWINAENAKGKSHKVGVTWFADLTFDEFRAQYLTGDLHMPINASLGVFHAPANFVQADSWDWTTKGAVTPIKDQAHCGSCWSFSATGALEGAWKIAGHDLVPMSEQNILDCDKGGHKCQGGSMEQAFDWVKANGLCGEEDDPYKCQDQSSSTCTGSTCAASSGSCSKILQVGDVTGSTEVGSTENALEAAVTKQPVSVAIEADKSVFQHYTGGVLKDEACGETLDHGVLVVGYGTDDTDGKYWKVKNSWGTSHGEAGYWRIERGSAQQGGECGIRKAAVFPNVKGGGPSPPSPPAPPAPPSPPSPPGSTHYEKPPCQSDEVAVQIQGADGEVCAAHCDSTPCPTDVPPGTKAKPGCVLQDSASGAKYCALTCTFNGCPEGAKCSGLIKGICLYPTSADTNRPTLTLSDTEITV